MITPELQRRIIVSLRWLITDAQYRFDECRRNQEEGSQGGYSDELKEAIAVLNELESPTLAAPMLPATNSYTQRECLDTGLPIGLTPDQCLEFFHHYNRQGWLYPTKLPVADLTSAMVDWRNNRHKYAEGGVPEPERNEKGLTPRQQDIVRRGT